MSAWKMVTPKVKTTLEHGWRATKDEWISKALHCVVNIQDVETVSLTQC